MRDVEVRIRGIPQMYWRELKGPLCISVRSAYPTNRKPAKVVLRLVVKTQPLKIIFPKNPTLKAETRLRIAQEIARVCAEHSRHHNNWYQEVEASCMLD